MRTKELGRTGVFLPEIGFGTWAHRGGLAPIERALDAGVVLLDTGESYGTEELVGQAVRGKRERCFIATKVSERNFTREAFRKAAEGSLHRLGLDCIDLLQLHHPNPQVPVEETLGALEELIDEGKVRYAGVSNFSVGQLRQAQQTMRRHPIVSNQVRYNIIDRTIEPDLLPYCQKDGITVIAYSPLARGMGRITDCDPNGAIERIAKATATSPAQVALNWCISKNRVIAIPGGNSVEHVLDNCAASSWKLTSEQLALLDSQLQFRRRNKLDMLLRQHTPRSLQNAAIRILNALPRGLRRRLT
jgi:aryl-alcohol dehydrogenase-like predicted oxidoreductase